MSDNQLISLSSN